MKSLPFSLLSLGLLSLGSVALSGCADPEATAYEAHLAYTAPLDGLDASDCAGSLERGRAAQKKVEDRLAALGKKVERVRDNDLFITTFGKLHDEWLERVEAFPASCLAEARTLNPMLEANATTLGLEPRPWLDTTPSKQPHRCVRRGSCEQYVGSGQPQSLRRDICERVGGEWSTGLCSPVGAEGVCRHDVGGDLERGFVQYGASPSGAYEKACTEAKPGKPAGTWRAFGSGSSASTPRSASPAASAPAATVPATASQGRSVAAPSRPPAAAAPEAAAPQAAAPAAPRPAPPPAAAPAFD